MSLSTVIHNTYHRVLRCVLASLSKVAQWSYKSYQNKTRINALGALTIRAFTIGGCVRTSVRPSHEVKLHKLPFVTKIEVEKCLSEHKTTWISKMKRYKNKAEYSALDASRRRLREGVTDLRTDRRMDGRTDIRTDGRMDRRTDRPTYRDARTHLKRQNASVVRLVFVMVCCLRMKSSI